MHRRARQFAFVALLGAASLAVAQGPPPDADAFLARDSHQGVTVAARPIPDLAEAEQIFGKKAAPVRAGVLPVELLVLNERPESIHVNLKRIKIMSEGEEFEQVDTEIMAQNLYPPPEVKQPDLGPKPQPPIPLPRRPGPPKDKKRAEREEADAALRSRQLRQEAVPPGGRIRGFLYFDLRGGSLDLARAQVFVPEVNAVESGEGLLFYEVSLKPYAKP